MNSFPHQNGLCVPLSSLLGSLFATCQRKNDKNLYIYVILFSSSPGTQDDTEEKAGQGVWWWDPAEALLRPDRRGAQRWGSDLPLFPVAPIGGAGAAAWQPGSPLCLCQPPSPQGSWSLRPTSGLFKSIL